MPVLAKIMSSLKFVCWPLSPPLFPLLLFAFCLHPARAVAQTWWSVSHEEKTSARVSMLALGCLSAGTSSLGREHDVCRQTGLSEVSSRRRRKSRCSLDNIREGLAFGRGCRARIPVLKDNTLVLGHCALVVPLERRIVGGVVNVADKMPAHLVDGDELLDRRRAPVAENQRPVVDRVLGGPPEAAPGQLVSCRGGRVISPPQSGSLTYLIICTRPLSSSSASSPRCFLTRFNSVCSVASWPSLGQPDGSPTGGGGQDRDFGAHHLPVWTVRDGARANVGSRSSRGETSMFGSRLDGSISSLI